MSAVPTAPWVFFQLPYSHVAYPGFSKQYEQWDNWQADTVRQGPTYTPAGMEWRGSNFWKMWSCWPALPLWGQSRVPERSQLCWDTGPHWPPSPQESAHSSGGRAILNPQGKTRVTALGKEVAEEWLRFHDYRPAAQCLMKALQPPDADPRQWGGFSRENIKVSQRVANSQRGCQDRISTYSDTKGHTAPHCCRLSVYVPPKISMSHWIPSGTVLEDEEGGALTIGTAPF